MSSVFAVPRSVSSSCHQPSPAPACYRTAANLNNSPPSTSYTQQRSFARQQAERPLALRPPQALQTVHSAEGSVEILADSLPRREGVFNLQNTDLGHRDFQNFVHFFRSASSYITGHRNSTFVIVLPGQACHLLCSFCSVYRAQSLHSAVCQSLCRAAEAGCFLAAALCCSCVRVTTQAA